MTRMQARARVEPRSWIHLAVAAAVLILAAAAFGCGSSDGNSTGTSAASTPMASTNSGGGEQARIAYFTAALQNPYTAAALKGIKEVANKRNASVQVFDANFDAQKQGSQIQDAVTSGDFDAFLILPVNGTIVPEVKEAVQAGIPVVSHDNPLGPDSGSQVQVPGVLASVMEDIKTDGTALADATVSACQGKDPCNVALIGGDSAIALDKAKWDTVEATLAQHPNIKVVGHGEGQFQESGGQKAMQDLLQANPKIDVLAVNGDNMAVGAEKAIKAAGRTDAIQIIGGGASRDGVAHIKDGSWLATTMYLPTTEGRIATDILLDKVDGKPVKEGQVIDPGVESKIGKLVTKETLAKDPSFVGEWNQ